MSGLVSSEPLVLANATHINMVSLHTTSGMELSLHALRGRQAGGHFHFCIFCGENGTFYRMGYSKEWILAHQNGDGIFMMPFAIRGMDTNQ